MIPHFNKLSKEEAAECGEQIWDFL
jgi:hypothetical protein